VQTRSVGVIYPHVHKYADREFLRSNFELSVLPFIWDVVLTGSTGSKHDVLGGLSLAFKWQNIQREANSTLCKLVIIHGVRKVAVHWAAVYRDRPRTLNL